ncbi:FTR1 family iron permease [Paramagnetospirillum magneticum]|uniref:High-affinity Fe2+/Pb2+ permease n=1 Tax=Paramagnetospirillum magneticum (strain ATCC 700264 / AMB-1) TaxID=342108 RepID=Q2W6P0_PARM1|nr:FTR1 family protein [Paramagnetospirillum magneticum]BAE50485.1 High-affinity Fe2+/Pb2+ permease [Paramagnetospirillum magneticum AMB-1]
MLASAVIVFREVLEAALIVGIVLAATKGLAGSRRWVTAGILAGLLGSAVIAGSAEALSDALSGMGQELFNASILGVAVLMLGWHTVWMSSHGREMAAEMKRVGHAVVVGARPLSVLAVVVGVAVLREGAETVLFVFGISTAEEGGKMATIAGCAVGLGAGITVGTLLYRGLLAIPTRHLFSVTTWLVTLLAAGMAAQAVTYLSAAGVIEMAPQPLWDTSWLLSETSIGGRLLHTLVGYMDRPSAVQLLAYGATLLGITALARVAGRQHA